MSSITKEITNFEDGYAKIQAAAKRSDQRLIVWLSGHCEQRIEQLSMLLAHGNLNAGEGAHESDPIKNTVQSSHVQSSHFQSNHVRGLYVSKAFGAIDGATQTSLQQYRVEICRHKTHLLGQQSDFLIYDAFQGFDPDLFCAACGTLKSGGLLCFLTPHSDTWIALPDKDYLSSVVYPHSIEHIKSRFIRRLLNCLEASEYVSHWRATTERWLKCVSNDLQAATLQPVSESNGIEYTQEQQQVMKAIRDLVDTDLPSPIVLTADRGRGKSSAIGAAIATCMARPFKVVVTAPNVQNTQALFDHCCRQLGIEQAHQDRIAYQELSVAYVPPDALMNQGLDVDLLVVDEAAAIPEFLLKQAVDTYKHIVFATTVHGYEGTGKGFEIRFQPYLDQQKPNWQLYTMASPIRWGNNDVVEAWLNEVFFFDRDFAQPLHQAQLDLSQCQFNAVTQEQLLDQPTLLEAIYSLLSQAHYRTSPGDLRDLLDGLNFRIWTLAQQGILLGCCLVAEEGGLDEEIVTAIDRGIRRPRGHLIPQTLCQQMGYKDYASEKIARIVRIAIAPNLQQKGLGSYMLEHVEKAYSAEHYSMIGSSFSAYPHVIRFWQRNLYHPVRLGFSKETSSGAHSLLVMKTLDMAVDPFPDMSAEFANDFNVLLNSEFRKLSGDVLSAIIGFLPRLGLGRSQPMLKTRARDIEMVRDFVDGARTFESARPALTRVFLQHQAIFHQPQQQPQRQDEALRFDTQLTWELFLKHKTLKDLQQLGIISGRKAAIRNLRAGFSELDIDHHDNAAEQLK